MLASGASGRSTYDQEPRRPRSSAFQAANRIERRGRKPDSLGAGGGDLEDPGDARRIVVRPGIHARADRSLVVEVCADDHPLVAEHGVASLQETDDVVLGDALLADGDGERYLGVGGDRRERRLLGPLRQTFEAVVCLAEEARREAWGDAGDRHSDGVDPGAQLVARRPARRGRPRPVHAAP